MLVEVLSLADVHCLIDIARNVFNVIVGLNSICQSRSSLLLLKLNLFDCALGQKLLEQLMQINLKKNGNKRRPRRDDEEDESNEEDEEEEIEDDAVWPPLRCLLLRLDRESAKRNLMKKTNRRIGESESGFVPVLSAIRRRRRPRRDDEEDESNEEDEEEEIEDDAVWPPLRCLLLRLDRESAKRNLMKKTNRRIGESAKRTLVLFLFFRRFGEDGGRDAKMKKKNSRMWSPLKNSRMWWPLKNSRMCGRH
ncbi:hypothetical protein Syun_007281 [Stephania yunnanensis]|uniref:Uncharacterized protein n=1 Tax=Stephania yunnanensis TaxID=152371 RepID=A0AAP0KZ85_9MAGN